MQDKSTSSVGENESKKEELLIMSTAVIASIWWTKEMAQRLRVLRGEESMVSLAKRAGCTYQMIQHLERGEYITEGRRTARPSVSWEKLESICDALSVPIEDFLQVELVKKPNKIADEA